MSNWLSRIFNRVSTPDPASGFAAWIPIPSLPDGFRLSQEQTLQVGAAWACVRLIAETVAAMPVRVVNVDAAGRKTRLPDDPLSYLLNVKPNGYGTAQGLKEAMIASALLHDGGGYSEIVRNSAGTATELRFMFAERVRVEGTKQGGAVYKYVDQAGAEVELSAADVLHFRGLSLDGLMGHAVALVATRAIAVAAAQDRYAANYFANSAIPSGIITAPVGKKISKEDREALVASLQKRAGGLNQFAPLVMDSGVTWTPLSQNPGAAQLVEGRHFSVEDVARYFGVPLVLLGVQAAAQGYGTNVEQLMLSWVRIGLKPWIRRIEQELTIKLAPRGPKYLQLDPTELTAGTALERANADKVRIESGVLSVNEARDAEGKDGIGDEGDLHLVPGSLVPLHIAEEVAQKKADAPKGLQAPAKDLEDDDATALLVAGVSLALDNHRRRWIARARNVSAEKVEAARADLRGKLAEDLEAFGGHMSDDAFAAMATAIESGSDPKATAAQHLSGAAP